jgi:hypothetical protein
MRPNPQNLVPAVNAAFAMRMPERMATDTTVFRCAVQRVMVCTAGANLPRGKANTSRASSAGIVQWCHDNPDAVIIPAVATGRDTIYGWRCRADVAPTVWQTRHLRRNLEDAAVGTRGRYLAVDSLPDLPRPAATLQALLIAGIGDVAATGCIAVVSVQSRSRKETSNSDGDRQQT